MDTSDNAGKLRAFLTACRQARSGELFVLLGGCQNIIPVRNAYEQSNHYIQNNGQHHPLGYYVPTDWYYIDLNGNWDYNKNGKYGEYNESAYIDFNPDIYVGRICCKNKDEIDNYTRKLVKYEVNPGNGNYTYLRNFIFTQADQMQERDQARESLNICNGLYDNYQIFEEAPGPYDSLPSAPFASEIVDNINATKYGFINFHNHGGVVAVTVKSSRYNINRRSSLVSMQKVSKKYSHAWDETRHGLDMIDNYDHPMICYSLGCTLMPYDNMLTSIHGSYYDENTKTDSILPKDIYNFGDSFTIGGLYGGPAIISNTRVGYISYSFNQELVFLGLLKNDGCLGRIRTLTQSLFDTPSKYEEEYVYHCKLTNNLLGCPEFKMWIKTPTIIDVSYPSSQTLTTRTFTCDNDVKVSGVSVSTGYVVPYSGTLSNGRQKISVPSENCVVTLAGDYKIPYLMPLTLNNVTFNADGYYYVSKVATSKPTRPSSIGFNKARVTFDAAGAIEINQDVTVDNGSDVTFISPELVKLKNLKVKNNSRVTIICSKGYTVEGTCDCELGSELIIKQNT